MDGERNEFRRIHGDEEDVKDEERRVTGAGVACFSAEVGGTFSSCGMVQGVAAESVIAVSFIAVCRSSIKIY
jgi:hypothetical protein